MHLWEVKHPYYCNQGNYFASGDKVHCHYRSFDDFISSEGDSDFDMNLLFRWDWQLPTDDDDKPLPSKGDNYRDGELLLFWMGQRKGIYRWTTIEVCRLDEPAVIAFLQPRLNWLAAMWAPLVPRPVETDCHGKPPEPNS